MNVNGVKRNGHLLIEHHLHKYHIACLQESKFRDLHHRSSFEYLVQAKFQAKIFSSDQNGELPVTEFPRSGGVVTVVHSDFPGFESAVVEDSRTIPNRYLVVRVMSEGPPLYIHNVYAPNDPSEKKRFFERLPTDFEPSAEHIVCGDFNTALDLDLDSARQVRHNDSSQPVLLEWLGQLRVSDAWRVHHPESRVFSGPRPRVNRLDYIFLTETLLCQLYGSSKYFEPQHGGDHLAHQVVLAPPKQMQGRSYWRFPRYLLEYPQVIHALKREVEDFVPVIESSSNPGIVWQVWKKRVAAMLQRICQRIQSEKSVMFRAASERVEELSSQVAQGTSTDPSLQTEYETACEHLRQVVETNSRYNQDTAFDLQAQDTERSSSYFFRPPSTNLRRTPIESVVLPDGSESSDPNLIAVEFGAHWGRIMGARLDGSGQVQVPSPSASCAQAKLLDTIDKTLNSDQRSGLDSEFTEEEFVSAIKSMSPHKAPGPDGLTAAFYQVAPEAFAKILIRVFKYQFDRKILLPDQRKSCIVLLHKKGSRAQPGNYRPIALMQVDVKVLSRVLTSRLRSLIPSLIDQDQKGFVRGRSIHHHIRALQDLQHLCTTEDAEGYATFLDFEKAYDRVRWDYLFAVMRRMNIGDGFVSWVQVLLKASRVSLVLNGWIQAPFEPTRGVKQGDPISPLLFLLSLEPMCNLLRQHSEFGIQVQSCPSITATGAYFADDSTLLSGSVDSLHQQLALVQVYCEASGAKLNQSKCVVLALNKNSVLPSVQGIRVLQDGETVTYLGVLFGRHDTSAQIVENLDLKLYKSLVLWHRRARTVEGRKLLAMSVILSTLWHVAVHVNIDSKHIQRWQSTINQFILRGYRQDRDPKSKLHLIPSRYLYQDRCDLGLQFPQIQATLLQQRLSFLQQFVHQVQSQDQDRFHWATVASRLFKCALGAYHGSSVTAFLWIDPVRCRSELSLQWLPLWWQQTWRQWIRQPWPVCEVSWKQLIQYPLWLSSQAQLKVPARSSSSCLGMPTMTHRPFRRWFVQHTKYSTLRDFVRPDGKWPNQAQFEALVNSVLARSALGDFDNYVELLPVRPKVKRLYQDLTTVVSQLLPGVDLTTFQFPSTVAATVPMCGVESGTKILWFPNIPAKYLRDVTRKIPEARKPHPVTQYFPDVSTQVAEGHLEFFIDCRRYLLPVVHDTMLRLLYRGLPTRSKFWFLQGSQPDVVCCEAPDCQAVETEEHLLFGCARVQDIWTELLPGWCQVTRLPSIGWKNVLLGLPPDRLRLPSDQVECIRIVWSVLCAVVLHHVWNTRNRWVFEQRDLPPAEASVKVILSVFASHLRFIDRVWRTSTPKTQALKWFQAQLLRHQPYSSYYEAHPELLQQRQPSITQCWFPEPRRR